MKHATTTAMTRYALGGVLAVVLLNLLLRSFVRIGGVLSTLLIATTVAGAMALWFAWSTRRAPLPAERWRLLGVYGGVLALLYLGLLAMMAGQDQPSPMGVFLLVLHYLCYPLAAYLCFSERVFAYFRPTP